MMTRHSGASKKVAVVHFLFFLQNSVSNLRFLQIFVHTKFSLVILLLIFCYLLEYTQKFSYRIASISGNNLT